MDDNIIEMDDKSSIQHTSEPIHSRTQEPQPVVPSNLDKIDEIKLISPEKLMPIPETKVVPEKKRKKYDGNRKKSEQIMNKNGEPVLSFYARQKLISLLQDQYTPGNPDNKIPLTLKLNYPKSQADKVVEYIECQGKHGEKNTGLYNNDESFIWIMQWLNLLHEKHMNDISGNELPLLFKLIANLEIHPEPEEIDNINLQELYIFLSNIMLGYPAKSPTGATGKFLHETFKSIMSEISSTAQDTRPLEEQLKKSTLIAGPDSADNFNLEELRLILCNSSTNPFNLPFEFLNLNHFENIFDDQSN